MDSISNNLQIAPTETPNGHIFPALLQEILKVVILPEELIKCVFAVALSIKLDLPSLLWLMLVGVPSSAKTDIVSILKELNFTYFIDSFTMNPFASGYKAGGRGKTYDLLPELDGKCFICKDYTTIFSLNEETTKKLLGELVSIYDGEFAKFSPTRGYKKYISSFSHIGVITPAALNHHQRYLNIIGPRFMFYRIPGLDKSRKNKGFSIAWNSENRKTVLRNLSKKVTLFFDKLLESVVEPFEITDEKTRKALEDLSLLMAKSRGIVVLQKSSFTNDSGKEILYYDVADVQVEEPWRAFQQLKGLGICLALIEGRKNISEADLKILNHVVVSSMPAERAEVLEFFLSHSVVTAKDLSTAIGKSVRTCQRLLKELEGLGIIKHDKEWQGAAKCFSLIDDFSMFSNNTDTTTKTNNTSEFMSQQFLKKLPEDCSDYEIINGIKNIKDFLLKNKDLADNDKEKYIIKAEQLGEEGVKRHLIEPNQLSIRDQVLAEESISEADLPF